MVTGAPPGPRLLAASMAARRLQRPSLEPTHEVPPPGVTSSSTVVFTLNVVAASTGVTGTTIWAPENAISVAITARPSRRNRSIVRIFISSTPQARSGARGVDALHGDDEVHRQVGRQVVVGLRPTGEAQG